VIREPESLVESGGCHHTNTVRAIWVLSRFPHAVTQAPNTSNRQLQLASSGPVYPEHNRQQPKGAEYGVYFGGMPVRLRPGMRLRQIGGLRRNYGLHL